MKLKHILLIIAACIILAMVAILLGPEPLTKEEQKKAENNRYEIMKAAGDTQDFAKDSLRRLNDSLKK